MPPTEGQPRGELPAADHAPGESPDLGMERTEELVGVEPAEEEAAVPEEEG